ncbi:hypothetical protein [Chitinolyticbacter albus]|uniref:hypothetical protein n=1 Tax=Chitinolyticbacter albus TaxID=2961951 RepID=UPI00210A396A|nr:hypothetical protein [Chitinolyticbacter albus]
MSALDLFLVEAGAISHWRWQHGALHRLGQLALTAPDALRCDDVARRCVVLVDLADEGFVLDSHNRLRRRHQLARSRLRLAEQWRHTPYRRAQPLADGRATLLCALPQHGSVDALLAALGRCHTIVTGIYSTAQLVAQLSPRLAGPRLLMFAAPGGGLRQCFQLNGELRFSRLCDHGRDYTELAPEAWATRLVGEVRQARQHLIAERQLTRDDTLQLTLLAREHGAATASALQALLYDEGGYRTDTLHPGQLTAGQHELLPALAAQLAASNLASHYGNQSQLHRYRLQRLLRLGNLATLGLVVTALGYAAYAHFETAGLAAARQQRVRDAATQHAEAIRLRHALGPHLAQAERMATVREFDQRYLNHWPALVPQLKAISRQLDGLSHLALERVHWRIDPAEAADALPPPAIELAGRVVPPYRAAASELDVLQQRLAAHMQATIVAQNRPGALDEAAALAGENSDEATGFALRFNLATQASP